MVDPVIYRGATLVKRVRPLSMSMTFSLHDYETAEMELAEADCPTLRLHDTVLAYTPAGSPIIYRITAWDRTYGGRVKLSLVNAIDGLNDVVYSVNGNVRQQLSTYISNVISTAANGIFWLLGTAQLGGDKWYRDEVKNESRLDLLNEVRDALADHMFTYTYTLSSDGHPSTAYLNVMMLPTTAGAEFRLSRNIKECRVTVDDTDMCNRIYMMFTRSSGSTVFNYTYDDTTSQSAYGVIEQGIAVTEDETGGATVALRQAWADRYFEQHNKPHITIDIDGYQLKALTGLDWDEASVGKLVRVSLPDYNDVYTERCIEVTYPDVIGRPEEVRVRLGRETPTISEQVAFTGKKTGTRSRRYLYGQSGTIVEEET